MQLAFLAFSEFPGQPNEWTLETLKLSNVNLLVGKNATGKTRTINVINFLSTLLTGQQKEVFSRGSYEAVFVDGMHTWRYSLVFANSTVIKEDLVFDGNLVLHRGQGDYGRILAEDIEDKPMIRFEVPGGKIAVFAKRDDVQHSFLRPLHEWASSVRHFKLGWEIRPHELSLAVRHSAPIPVNEKDTSHLVPIFNKAKTELGDPYVRAIIADMQEMGYDIDEIDIRAPDNLITNAILPGELVGISVRENDLRCFVDQPSISQGMFRALSLLAQINYYLLAKKAACILADDVGEGLDFERSCALIGLLRKKTEQSEGQIQLVMSTNDRFVMNEVPLDEWSVLQRVGHRVRVRNHENSKEVFEEFKYTGLSNFDLLATDYLDQEPEEVAARE